MFVPARHLQVPRFRITQMTQDDPIVAIGSENQAVSHGVGRGELLDRIGARPVMLTLLSTQVVLLMFLTQATGWTALFLTLLLVTFIFAEIPVTTWLLGHYLDPAVRSRAVSVEYVLSLGVGSAAVPLIAFLYGRGLGFDFQFTGLALSAGLIIAAVLFLPRQMATVPQHEMIPSAALDE